ncbi:MAG TPA: TlpA disulfide reductase family protein [Ilumatobacter sp.]|nr:TlpA disulfide reductase family protein [Ilumatobacter sp.]
MATVTEPSPQSTRRAVTWALCAGVLAIAATLVIAARLTRDEPTYEASVKLDEPGFFTEPSTVGNADRTGTPLPDVTFTDATGATRTLAEFRGTPMVVNLWYKACAPCARELPEFAAVDAELRAAGRSVQFVGLNPMDSVDTMMEFATERGVEYELWRDTQRTFGVEIGAVLYPVTLYVDADGQVVKQVGETTADELRTTITDLFG